MVGQHERRGGGVLGQPGARGRQGGDQVQPCCAGRHRVVRGGVAGERDVHDPGAAVRGRHDALPQCAPGHVERDDLRAPGRQWGERADLGARAHQRDAPALEA
ncbi:MAG TPA: hypothetical protein VFN44_12805 [Solirubrobacteraceae bacterium]|nr:hypothetical protein [Solirubrobacteraceae bacterium]